MELNGSMRISSEAQLELEVRDVKATEEAATASFPNALIPIGLYTYNHFHSDTHLYLSRLIPFI